MLTSLIGIKAPLTAVWYHTPPAQGIKLHFVPAAPEVYLNAMDALRCGPVQWLEQRWLQICATRLTTSTTRAIAEAGRTQHRCLPQLDQSDT